MINAFYNQKERSPDGDKPRDQAAGLREWRATRSVLAGGVIGILRDPDAAGPDLLTNLSLVMRGQRDRVLVLGGSDEGSGSTVGDSSRADLMFAGDPGTWSPVLDEKYERIASLQVGELGRSRVGQRAHHHRLFRQRIVSLRDQFDLLLVDLTGSLPMQLDFCFSSTSELVVVLNGESSDFFDVYAAIKHLVVRQGVKGLHFLVARAESEASAFEISKGLSRVVERFLGIRPNFLGHLPTESFSAQARRMGMPVLLAYPYSPTSRQLRAVGQRLLEARRAATNVDDAAEAG